MTADEYIKHYASGQGGFESVSVDIALRAIEYAKQEMKQQMIEKAIEWVEYNNKNGGCKFDGWVENIKQAMKDE